jgi:hypothetical protein
MPVRGCQGLGGGLAVGQQGDNDLTGRGVGAVATIANVTPLSPPADSRSFLSGHMHSQPP